MLCCAVLCCAVLCCANIALLLNKLASECVLVKHLSCRGRVQVLSECAAASDPAVLSALVVWLCDRCILPSALQTRELLDAGVNAGFGIYGTASNDSGHMLIQSSILT